MRAVLQRVSEAAVQVGDARIGSIGPGLLVLLAIEESDSEDDIAWLAGKIVRLRIFDDAGGVMNLSVTDAGGDILLVSQFTLYASTRKGNRPSYTRSAPPAVAVPLFDKFKSQLEREFGKSIATGQFGADMQVQLVNNGPVTIIIDSKTRD